MGKGGAQLGKSLKGKTKEQVLQAAQQQAEQKKVELAEVAATTQLDDDVKQMAEYERLAKLAEAHRQRLKKLAADEALNTNTNRAVLMAAHRKMMRSEKLESLRNDVQVLADNHEQQVERKDTLIHLLGKEISDIADQFQTAQRSHMEKIDTLVSFHDRKVRQLEFECERDLKLLKLEFENEREKMVTQHERQVREITAIITAVESEERRRADEARQAHETEREEIRNKNLEDINMLRIHLENKIGDLERQFDEAHQNYVMHTDQANKQFKKLVKKDKALTKQIEAQKSKIARCQARLISWKRSIAQNEKECRERNDALRRQKELIARHCQELEYRTKKQRDDETKNLCELSQWSRDAMRSNTEKLDQAERILKMAELTRKLDTEQESVVPFYASTLTPEEEEQTEREDLLLTDVFDRKAATVEMEALMQETGDVTHTESNRNYSQQWAALDNFYRRYNKVLLDKIAIEQEKKRLAKENGDLRTLIKQYLDGVSVPQDAVDSANPLLIVNGRVNVDQVVRRRVGPGPTVEAALAVRTMAQHNRTKNY